jgi:hypothetical protein
MVRFLTVLVIGFTLTKKMKQLKGADRGALRKNRIVCSYQLRMPPIFDFGLFANSNNNIVTTSR